MEVRIAVSEAFLAFIGIALIMPSAIVIALSPANAELMLISGLYIASGMMAIAAISLLAKRLKLGGILGITSCFLGFSSSILFSAFMALTLIAPFEYMPGLIVLMAAIGVVILPQVATVALLISIFDQLKG